MVCPSFLRPETAYSSELKAEGCKAQGSRLKAQGKKLHSYRSELLYGTVSNPAYRTGRRSLLRTILRISILQPHGILLNYFRNDDKTPDPHDQTVSSD